MGICTELFFSESTKPVDLICSMLLLSANKDLKNMLVDNLLPELKLKQSNILTMGDFNFDFRFSEFMEHTFNSKQIVS